jgi:hypothetical protein
MSHYYRAPRALPSMISTSLARPARYIRPGLTICLSRPARWACCSTHIGTRRAVSPDAVGRARHSWSGFLRGRRADPRVRHSNGSWVYTWASQIAGRRAIPRPVGGKLKPWPLQFAFTESCAPSKPASGCLSGPAPKTRSWKRRELF